MIRSACIALALSAPLFAQQIGPRPISPSTAELVAHYTRVLVELRAADVGHLTDAQRAERTRLIEVLDRYCRAADFGVNTRHSGERKAYFVDDAGRRCAVAFLLDHSGKGELTKRVARTANHAWVAELAADRELLDWLDRSGLTIEEAGRIQGPVRRIEPPPDPIKPYDREEWIREFRPERGQGDAGPGPGGNGDRNPGGSPSAPVTMPRRSANPTPSGPKTPRGTPLSALPSQAWSTWWQWNRDEFIFPRAKVAAPSVSTNQTVADPRVARVDRLFDRLTGYAKADHARIRRAAAVAMGRLGDARAIPFLVDMLDDASHDVRHAAILALGSTGTSRAVHELLHIAKNGRARGTDDEVSQVARPLATIALGLARRYGSSVETAKWVHDESAKIAKPRIPDMHLARLLYQVLAPEKNTADFARSLAEAKKTPLDVRCRAIEVLPSAAADRAALATLIKALNGSRLEARRSSALALGHFDHRLALGPLMTAFELEGELLTRAFLLLSIGRQGSPAGRDFLLEQVKKGRKTLRPWAAVGLGLSARKSGRFDDKAARAAIYKTYRSERNRDGHGAYLIALGLMRDRGSVTMLLHELQNAKNSLTRTAAAEALILVGKDVARPALRKLVQDDQCYYARGMYASILGVIGDPADAPLLTRALREEAHPEARSQIAAALGKLDGGAGFDALLPMVDQKELTARTRAQVIEGLGASLSRNKGMEMSDLYQRANFLVFPGWLQEIGVVRL